MLVQFVSYFSLLLLRCRSTWIHVNFLFEYFKMENRKIITVRNFSFFYILSYRILERVSEYLRFSLPLISSRLFVIIHLPRKLILRSRCWLFQPRVSHCKHSVKYISSLYKNIIYFVMCIHYFIILILRMTGRINLRKSNYINLL